MIRGWKVAYDSEAVEFLLDRPSKERRRLIQFAESLKSNPTLAGDFVEEDDDARPLQMKLVDRFLVTYWADHAVKEVKIVRIETAD
jgi:hypothetical protein